MGNNGPNGSLIPHNIGKRHRFLLKGFSLSDDLMVYQLVGRVTANKATTDSRPERATGHGGTEIRAPLLREAAVGNFGQWTKV